MIVVEFVVQDCPIMGKVIHRHYIEEDEQAEDTKSKKRVQKARCSIK